MHNHRFHLSGVWLSAIGIAVGLTLLWAAGASASECANSVLREESHSGRLPDCRAYELVSPVAKNGWPVNVNSANGSHVIMASLGAFAGSAQGGLENVYDAERTPLGWSTSPLVEPEGLANPQEEPLLAGSMDLSKGLFDYIQANPHERNLYINSLPQGAPVEIGPVFSSEAVAKNPANTFAAPTTRPSASSDLTTVIFAMEGPTVDHLGVDYLWPYDETIENTGPLYRKQGFYSLYEYRGTGNKTKPALVGVDSNEHMIGQCGVSLGFPSNGEFTGRFADDLYNAISSDGSRVFFTVSGATQGEKHNSCTGEGVGTGPPADELFGRIYKAGNTTATEKYETVNISEPSKDDCVACDLSTPADAIFQGASTNGSKVFFLSTQRLLPGAGGVNLYEYDFNGEAGAREMLVAPDVQGVARVSADGSHVYFVAQSGLTADPNPGGDLAPEGADNLYVFDTTAERMAFIGALCSGAGVSGTIVDGKCPASLNSLPPSSPGSLNDLADWQQEDERPVETSADGHIAIFTSSADLTPGDTSGVAQLFEYNAEAKTLVRISEEQGRSGEYPVTIVTHRYTVSQDPAPVLSSISADGSYVVFQSGAVLVPSAAPGAANVYEYHEGGLALISDGQDTALGGGLLGIDESDEDIFFASADRLVSQDGDTQRDVYDARINGGFPSAVGSSTCDGDACQGGLVPAPAFAPVDSANRSAGDNIVEPASRQPATKSRRVAKHKKTKPRKKRAKHRGKTKIHRVVKRVPLGRGR